MLVQYINQIFDGKALSSKMISEALELITSGTVPAVQVGAFLTALRMKGITGDELLGGAKMLRNNALYINSAQRNLVDIVGTGGDCSMSFNISTTSSFVIAGAGVPVAKHGNRASSSLCGAADVLEALGYNLDAPVELIEYSIAEYGIGFLYARKMHPLLGKVGALRRELRIRTIFNLLGPLCNPVNVDCMVLGVYAPELTELFAEVLKKLGMKRARVVHGMDGLDEISSCAPTRVSELKDDYIKTYELLPELLLGSVASPEELQGGNPKTNGAILKGILHGEIRHGARSAVLLNAGAAIYTYGKAADLAEGVKMAAESIDSGAALQKLNTLIEVSNG